MFLSDIDIDVPNSKSFCEALFYICEVGNYFE